MPDILERGLSRRSILAGAGGSVAGITAVLATQSSVAVAEAAPPVDADGVCFVFPELVDGPYYEDKAIVRRDITEGKPGIPLELRVRLVDAQCRPIAGARVDTWQADRLGIYSDFPNQGDDLKVATLGQTFLRGTQTTDAHGRVTFQTIFPGWYRSRTAHIHFKIYIGGKNRLTTQMFFPDALNEYIYTHAPGYAREAVRDTINMTDWIMAEATRHAVAELREDVDRYVASITYGVNPGANPPASEKMPCPPAPALCVPPLGSPPVGADRIAALIPSVENGKRPAVAKPGTPRRKV